MSHIRREFTKILFQKRTYFGWAGLFVVPFLMALAVRFGSGPGGQEDTQANVMGFYLAIIGSNGLYLAIGALGVLTLSLLPLVAAISGSQTVATEAEKGTLRTTLMQPVRRGALLVGKWFVANVYVAIALLVLLVGSLIAGGAFFGVRSLTVIATGGIGLVSVKHGLALICMGYLFVLVALASAVSLALLFSTLTDSGLTAVAGSMVLVFIMVVLGQLPQLDFLDPYLFTSHFTSWVNVFRDPIVWTPIRDALINFAAWIAGTTALAWIIFRRKDIHS